MTVSSRSLEGIAFGLQARNNFSPSLENRLVLVDANHFALASQTNSTLSRVQDRVDASLSSLDKRLRETARTQSNTNMALLP